MDDFSDGSDFEETFSDDEVWEVEEQKPDEEVRFFKNCMKFDHRYETHFCIFINRTSV